MSHVRWITPRRIVLALVAVTFGLGLLGLAQLRVVRTPNGVHAGLALALPFAALRFPSYAGTADSAPRPDLLGGPVVRLTSDGGWHARWVCGDRTEERNGHADTFVVTCGRHTLAIRPVVPPIPASVGP
ncbi:MAG: hypothetical protein MUE41_18075, partial [Gemmatimonadaceae bacterium]|nr:hypothetical protein [Gemmatimonadaceae bacterium]